jgi:hypothetical protein
MPTCENRSVAIDKRRLRSFECVVKLDAKKMIRASWFFSGFGNNTYSDSVFELVTDVKRKSVKNDRSVFAVEHSRVFTPTLNCEI